MCVRTDRDRLLRFELLFLFFPSAGNLSTIRVGVNQVREASLIPFPGDSPSSTDAATSLILSTRNSALSSSCEWRESGKHRLERLAKAWLSRIQRPPRTCTPPHPP